ncbi:cobalamin-independent methionine synthase II family protein [Rothia aerolata]|uniref:Methionine synthase n=1 Tax=Rothia aerolata TaxID=1812262 RepID=A0A917IV64_9MICC|nr:cobalamin-independent methionine synthase II family protein [Rothia aerolata]GGH64576.1 methionine synthase [Rothia aerolata]
MALHHSTDRILTTHVGSLPRPERLLSANTDRQNGSLSEDDFQKVLAEEVEAVVKKQVETGIDIVNDGEYGHSTTRNNDFGSWWTYSFLRTGGLELTDTSEEELFATPGNGRLNSFKVRRDWNKYADFYSTLNLRNENDGVFPVATGPLTYIGQEDVAADVRNVSNAVKSTGATEGFVAALSPGSAARIGNKYYKTDKEWLFAWADVLKEEYKAIAGAGLSIQIDDPSFAESWDQLVPEPTIEQYIEFTELAVEAQNYALADIPEDQVRFHLCWGSWHGPHSTDIELKHILPTLLELKVGGFTFEAANARHAHEWKEWEKVDLGKKILYPGCVSHSTNVVEHPELVAQRIEQFASVVPKENIVASTDCGLGGRLHEDIAWAKLRSLTEGAAIASERLF